MFVWCEGDEYSYAGDYGIVIGVAPDYLTIRWSDGTETIEPL